MTPPESGSGSGSAGWDERSPGSTSRSDRPPKAAIRVLIVDDEPTYREYLERYLIRDGLEVRTAETGAEAIRLAREFSPDVLLADWMLRCEMHGIEVGEVLRNQWPELRILLMTGFPTTDLEAEATRVGIDGFLEKPFSLEDLSAAIRRALGTGPSSSAA
ncbi:MAG TPA: response regulator [Deltaproteobacteria bacterium]|nr:response regulator [Deltaproteobacteria bacterium]